jgi:hypothetical protein
MLHLLLEYVETVVHLVISLHIALPTAAIDVNRLDILLYIAPSKPLRELLVVLVIRIISIDNALRTYAMDAKN